MKILITIDSGKVEFDVALLKRVLLNGEKSDSTYLHRLEKCVHFYSFERLMKFSQNIPWKIDSECLFKLSYFRNIFQGKWVYSVK